MINETTAINVMNETTVKHELLRKFYGLNTTVCRELPLEYDEEEAERLDDINCLRCAKGVAKMAVEFVMSF